MPVLMQGTLGIPSWSHSSAPGGLGQQYGEDVMWGCGDVNLDGTALSGSRKPTEGVLQVLKKLIDVAQIL